MKNNHLILALLTMLALSQTAAAVSKTTLAGFALIGGAAIAALKDTELLQKKNAQPLLEKAGKEMYTASNSIVSFSKKNPLAVALAATGGLLLLPYKKTILGVSLVGAGIGYYVHGKYKESSAEDETKASSDIQ